MDNESPVHHAKVCRDHEGRDASEHRERKFPSKNHMPHKDTKNWEQGLRACRWPDRGSALFLDTPAHRFYSKCSSPEYLRVSTCFRGLGRMGWGRGGPQCFLKSGNWKPMRLISTSILRPGRSI